MSSDIWSGVPQFTAGQILSANGQLNLLSDDLQWIKTAALGSAMPMWAGRIFDERHGFMRHKHNTLSVWLALDPDESFEVKVQGVSIYKRAQHDSSGTPFFGLAALREVIISYDLSAADIAPNQIYEIAFTSSGGVNLLLHCAEQQDETPYRDGWDPDVDWHDGGVPTEARWQEISAYVDALHERVTPPRVPFIYWWSREDPWGLTSWMCHRARWLELKAQCRPPQGSGYRSGYLEFAIWLYHDGAWARRTACVVHGGDTPHDFADRPDFSCGSNGDVAREITVENGLAIDLEAIDFGSGRHLTMGDRYLLQVGSYKGGGGEDLTQPRPAGPTGSGDFGDPGGASGGASSSACQLWYVQEGPDGTPVVPGWVDPPTWTPLTDYVYGDTTAKNIWGLFTPMMLLHDVTAYMHQLAVVSGSERHCVRQHRYLHYTCAKGATPKLTYQYNEFYHEDVTDKDGTKHLKGDAKKTEASLAVAYSELELLFLAYDLSSVAGLWPGVEYTLTDVLCAFEDTEP